MDSEVPSGVSSASIGESWGTVKAFGALLCVLDTVGQEGSRVAEGAARGGGRAAGASSLRTAVCSSAGPCLAQRSPMFLVLCT